MPASGREISGQIMRQRASGRQWRACTKAALPNRCENRRIDLSGERGAHSPIEVDVYDRSSRDVGPVGHG